jgi:hypothetical protein
MCQPFQSVLIATSKSPMVSRPGILHAIHMDYVLQPFMITGPSCMCRPSAGHSAPMFPHHCTGPIPICVGAFGETNTSFDKLVIKLANLAAKTPYGRRLSPYPLQSGHGADTLLRIQFCHVLGVQFVKANARHKQERLHLVGSTRDEAVHLATAKNSKILVIGILILTVLPDITTTTAKAATTNLGMSFRSPVAIFLFDFLI